MNRQNMVVLNFQEVRRRSILVWRSIPREKLNWKPDSQALTCSEMIRHVLEAEFLYHTILISGGSSGSKNIDNPFMLKEFTSLEDELTFIQPFRNDFLEYIEALSEQDLDEKKINREDVGYTRTLEDMLLRIAYHESVHTGQLLGYMRQMKLERPNIWD